MWVWDLSERGASGQTGKQDKRNLADVEQSKHYDRKGWKVIRITCFKILAVIIVREKRPLFNQVRRQLSILMNVRLNQEWKGAKRKLKITRFAIIWKISAAVAVFDWMVAEVSRNVSQGPKSFCQIAVGWLANHLLKKAFYIWRNLKN